MHTSHVLYITVWHLTRNSPLQWARKMTHQQDLVFLGTYKHLYIRLSLDTRLLTAETRWEAQGPQTLVLDLCRVLNHNCEKQANEGVASQMASYVAMPSPISMNMTVSVRPTIVFYDPANYTHFMTRFSLYSFVWCNYGKNVTWYSMGIFLSSEYLLRAGAVAPACLWE